MQPSKFRALVRLFLFGSVTAILVPPYLLSMPFSSRAARAISRFWYGIVCRLAGLRLRLHGTPSTIHPTLFVSNHVSYLDIPILAWLIDGVFVAKAEVASWPVFGFLARIARTVFIQRTAVHAARQREKLARRLVIDNLILFPEGTSSSGLQVLPFKSALFSVAKHGPGPSHVKVQPVSVAYVGGRDGVPLIDGRQDWYAWYGDMVLGSHLLNVFALPGADVEVTFHDPVDADGFETRKELAKYCHEQIDGGVTAAHAGAKVLEAA